MLRLKIVAVFVCRMKVNCSPETKNVVDLYKTRVDVPRQRYPAAIQRTRRQAGDSKANGCNVQFDMTSQVIDGHTYYNTSVSFKFKSV